MVSKRWLYAVWLALILGFAGLHALHLTADFPNHTPWYNDWAKYTDEGWYGNAAIRAHLFGNWYLSGDFNPAPALPAWPFVEWLLFFFTGVTLQAARGLAVALFFANLILTYLLLRARGPRWTGLIAVTLLVTSPFLYCFSRLAILEPMLTALALLALNLAARLGRWSRPILVSVIVGLLFTLMMLTKTTAIFLLPALGWATLVPLRKSLGLMVRCALAAAASTALSYGLWMAVIVKLNLVAEYRYLFFVNTYPKPSQIDWPLMSLWWSFHGGLWVDHILIPLAGVIGMGALIACRTKFGRDLLTDPVFGASVLAVTGYLLFMTVQNHPQPRYFAVIAFFCFVLVAQGAAGLIAQTDSHRKLGWAVLALAVIAATVNAAWTISYAIHPEYTFLAASEGITRYIDRHQNGKRLLVSISGDQITLATHLPTICDDFGTEELSTKMYNYQPGWYAAWNDLDPGTLADIHTHYSLEQVASFHAFDDPDRNVLVLFKLHPLANGQIRDQWDQNLQVPLPEDKIDVPVE
jgi:4-amino-4-deoxy-L-arabinose transferase-like glycosyltransferase